jgi:hypothetical protein
MILLGMGACLANAQSSPEQVKEILNHHIQDPVLVEFQLKQYLMGRVPPLPMPRTSGEWTAAADRIRSDVLTQIVFHGWPKEWVEAPPRFEDLGPLPSGGSYRMRRLRFEIVPGFWSTAILYAPVNLQGTVPAVLDVSGHFPALGKATDFKQKRDINYAFRGMLALNLEWLNMGELHVDGNDHGFGGHLELVGASAEGLFYLAMRKGLDYLWEHPNVDHSRIGMTGLSGGGWQTIVLSSLDERVSVAVPVAGYDSFVSDAEHPEWVGVDIEWNATDFRKGQDYTTFTAMRAPRPTLLIYNAEDDCCFRAPIVKPYIFDAVKPFFRLYGQEDAFQWHENADPGTHNYQLDNRQQSYRFFTKYFHLPDVEREVQVGNEIKSFDELKVGVPKDNLSILDLARKLASGIRHQSIPSEGAERRAWTNSERLKLKGVLRYTPINVKHAWAEASTKNRGVETISYRFEFHNGLSATGVWLKAIGMPENAPTTLILDDEGKKSASGEVSDRINRGEQAIAIDLLFTGDASMPTRPQHGPPMYCQALATSGDRPLGMAVAQLIAIANWMRAKSGQQTIRLQSTGIRSQVEALVAAALEPFLFSELVTHRGMSSLAYLLAKPVTYEEAPDLFCLDLYKEFDVDSLIAIADPTKISPLEVMKMKKAVP